MPSYEYQCPECNTVRIVRHGMDEEPEVRCDRATPDTSRGQGIGGQAVTPCGAVMERLISMPGIQVEGGASPSRPSKDRD